MNRYYLDESMAEHTCCWDTAVVRKRENGPDKWGRDVERICECRDSNAQMICDALNAYLDNHERTLPQ